MVELRVTLGAFGVEDGPTLLHVETTMTAIGTRSSFRKFFVLVNSNSTLDNDDANYVAGHPFCSQSAIPIFLDYASISFRQCLQQLGQEWADP